MNKLRSAIAAVALTTVYAPAMAGETALLGPVEIPAPPAGKGQIVFFRPGGMGMAIGCSVNENGQKVSSLGSGRYFVMVAAPGRHAFSVKSEAKDELALEVEPDETQYVACKIKMGFMVGRPDIAPSTQAAFQGLKHMKMVDADDMNPAAGALSADQVTAALAKPATATAAPATPQQ